MGVHKGDSWSVQVDRSSVVSANVGRLSTLLVPGRHGYAIHDATLNA